MISGNLINNSTRYLVTVYSPLGLLCIGDGFDPFFSVLLRICTEEVLLGGGVVRNNSKTSLHETAVLF